MREYFIKKKRLTEKSSYSFIEGTAFFGFGCNGFA